MEDTWKREIVKRAMQEGLLNDPHWIDHFDEPMPAWAVMEALLELLDKLNPPFGSYD